MNQKIIENVKEIISYSSEYAEKFLAQNKKDQIIAEIHEKTNGFDNISFDDLSTVAETFNELIYAVPLQDDFLYIYDNTNNDRGKEIIAFTSNDELEEFKKVNNCEFTYITFRDALLIKNNLDLDTFTVFLTNYYLNLTKENLDEYYNIYIYDNLDTTSTYFTNKPKESFEKSINILKEKFKEFEELKAAWLYHVVELKKDSKAEIKNEFDALLYEYKMNENKNISPTELFYEVVVLDIEERFYRDLKHIILNAFKEENKQNVKVVIKQSDMGMFLTDQDIIPFYRKDNNL